MPIAPNRTVTALIGEQDFIGKAITMIAVDWDVDADASREAMEAVSLVCAAPECDWPGIRGCQVDPIATSVSWT